VAVLTAALLALTFALIEGQTYGWTSALILSLFGVTVVGLALFILVQRRQVQPLMQLSMFRSRTFTVTNILGLILQFGMMGVFFLLPVFLQAVLGYSAIRAGLAMTPLAAMVIIAAPIAGTLSDRVGPRWLMFAGMVITAIGFILTRRAMVVGATWQSLVLPFAVSGFGIALVMPPSTSAVMGAVTREKAGQASGVLTTMRQVGAVLGIAVMGAVLQNRAVTYIRDGVSAKLDASPVQIPAGTKQSILDSINSSSINMGQLRTGAGFNVSMPSSVTKILSGLPESVASQLVSSFKSLFSLDFIMGEFSRAMRTTYVFSIILMVLGAVLALFVRSRLKQPEARQDAPEEESARAD
jgi:MFS family permease